jgi:drug/metabolite transporter (DMT)-like permease
MTIALQATLIAFLGYSLQNISQATQKMALDIQRRHKKAGFFLWCVATFFTLFSNFIVLYAVSIGNVSLVGALSGTGLLALVIYSDLVLKEKVSRWELLSIVIIISGIILMGAFEHTTRNDTIRINLLIFIFTISTIAGIIITVFLARKKRRTALSFTFLSGILGGFLRLFQKVSTTRIGKEYSFINIRLENTTDSVFLDKLINAAQSLTNPFTFLWVILSIVSMVLMQFAYSRDRAITLIPIFLAITILIPVCGGVLFFLETLMIPQVAGVLCILGGAILLILKARKLPALNR